MSNTQSDEEIDKIIRQSIEFYARNYDLKTWTVGRGQKRVVLGKDGVRRCRFCSRASPDVSFRNEAHAIPESLGNNNIFTKYECDSCNQKFGDTIENDFANWMLPIRTIAGIRGKNKYPTIKSKDGKSRLDSSHAGLNVDHHSGDDFFVPDEENKTLTFNLSVPPYRPIGAWKALIKMGISLIDNSRIGYFENTIKWLMDDPSHRPIRLWPVQSYTIPGSGRSDSLSVAMLYRNSDYIKLPYAMMFILYGLQSFQVIIPSYNKDFAVPSPELDLPILSLFDVDSIRRYGIPQLRQLDLSGTEVIKDDMVTIHGTFDNREKVDTFSDGPSKSQSADP